MKVKIFTFAMLKEHFTDSFELDIINSETVGELRMELAMLKPGAEALLNVCRFAINNIFVNDKKVINENDYIFVIPPSSGG